MEILKLENIVKIYQVWEQEVKALRWVDLSINKWEFVSITWESWSGKSTLMNIIWMLDTPTSGRYFFEWREVEFLSDDDQAIIRGQTIWFIFQSYNLIPKTPVLKQVMIPLMYQWISKEEREERAYQALKKVWLESKALNMPTQLSWWQQQRVAIARAIVTNPWIILWDEPTWALDSNTWREIMDLITSFNDEWRTIIIITHTHEVAKYAKRNVHIIDWLIKKDFIQK